MRMARVAHLAWVAGALLLAVVLRLWWLQVLHKDYWIEEAEFSRMDLRTLPFQRGRILDRDGRVLAEDRVTLELRGNYRDFRREQVYGQLLEAGLLLGDRDLGLPQVAREAERHAVRLLELRPQDFAHLGDDDATDLRYYLREACGLPSSEGRAIQEWAAEGDAAFGVAFPHGQDALLLRVAKARVAEARLESALREAAAAAGEEPGPPLLVDLEEERRDLQRQVRRLAVREAVDRAFPELSAGVPRSRMREGGEEGEAVLAALRQRWRLDVAPEDLRTLLLDEVEPAEQADALRRELLPGIGAAAPGDVAGLRRGLYRTVHGDSVLRLRRDVSYEVAELLVRDAEDYPGLYVLEAPDRVYPLDVAPHLVGRLRLMGDEQVEEYRAQRREYQRLSRAFYRSEADEERFRALQHSFLAHSLLPGDRIGASGVEATYEAVLRGERGYQRVLHGAEEGTGSRELVWQPPRHGEDVVLSLDVEAQLAAEDALREAYRLALQAARRDPSRWEGDPKLRDAAYAAMERPRAGFVVLDLEDGGLPVLATLPTYTREELRSDYLAVAEDPDRPMRHRALGGNATGDQIPYPGSTFKLLTAAMLFEQDPIGALSRPYVCEGRLQPAGGGKPLSCEGNHGTIRLHRALKLSCNIYFYHLAEDLGYEAIYDYARRLGFGQPTGIELVEVVEREDGSFGVGGDSWTLEYGANELAPPLVGRGRPQDLRSTMRLAIGQTCVVASPLQMARLYAWLATGELPTPRLVREGRGASPAAPRLRPPPMEDGIARTALHGAMSSVVREFGGTAYDVDHPLEDFGVVGKTGTAQIDDGVPVHAWFAAFFPIDNPRYAAVVFCENAGVHGGEIAADALYLFLDSPAGRELEGMPDEDSKL